MHAATARNAAATTEILQLLLGTLQLLLGIQMQLLLLRLLSLHATAVFFIETSTALTAAAAYIDISMHIPIPKFDLITV